MNMNTGFHFPGPDSLQKIKNFYASINGSDSFCKQQHWGRDNWAAEVDCSRGAVLEKAGIAAVQLSGGTVEGMPADIKLVQTIAWPVNPCMPGLIIMASASRMAEQNVMVMLYTDLIIQNGLSRAQDKEIFTGALKDVCTGHGQNIEEYQAFMFGRGMLGGCAAECGLLYFFEESDAVLLREMIHESCTAYRRIIEEGQKLMPSQDDFVKMKESRQKILEWMMSEDYGVKVARQNSIPTEIMALYGFPPGMDKKPAEDI